MHDASSMHNHDVTMQSPRTRQTSMQSLMQTHDTIQQRFYI